MHAEYVQTFPEVDTLETDESFLITSFIFAGYR